MVLRVDPEPYLADLQLFLPLLDQVFRDATIKEADQHFLRIRFTAVIGEYLRQRFHGRWSIDDTPFSRTFAAYVIDVPHDASGLGTTRICPIAIADELVTSPPPRPIAARLAQLASVLERAAR